MQREQTEIPSEGGGDSVAEQSRSGRQAVDVTDARPEPNGGARMSSGGPTCVQGNFIQPSGPAVSQHLLNEILSTAETYFRAGGTGGSPLLESTIREAVRASDEEYGIAAAVQWAAGYRFPKEMVKGDERCLQAAQLDFIAMVRRWLITLAPFKPNRERARELREGNPERDLVMELATKGIKQESCVVINESSRVSNLGVKEPGLCDGI